MSARRKPAGKVTLQVADRCVVYIDGQAYLAGQELELDADEARAYLESGLAVKPGAEPEPEDDPAPS